VAMLEFLVGVMVALLAFPAVIVGLELLKGLFCNDPISWRALILIATEVTSLYLFVYYNTAPMLSGSVVGCFMFAVVVTASLLSV
jgi:hypothetical protein